MTEIYNNHSKRGYIAYMTNKINELIVDGKFNVAKKMILELLPNYPYDYGLKVQFSMILILEKKYEEAKMVLEELSENHVFNRLAQLYIKLNDDDKLYQLYNKYYKNDHLDARYYDSVDYNRLKIYLRKKYDSNYLLDVSNALYSEKQIYNYSIQRAIQHIKSQHSFDSSFDKPKFYEYINITSLFFGIKEYIESNKDKANLRDNITESYLFKFLNCGEQSKINYDYLEVITLINSSNIITMYPTKCLSFGDICCLRDEKEGKVKIKSGLERFQNKYGRS